MTTVSRDGRKRSRPATAAGQPQTMTQLLSITADAELLSCSRGHIYNLIAQGQLRAVEIKTAASTRSKTRVYLDDLEAFIASTTRVAKPGTGGGASEARRFDGI